jgi:hypothetical protein
VKKEIISLFHSHLSNEMLSWICDGRGDRQDFPDRLVRESVGEEDRP